MKVRHVQAEEAMKLSEECTTQFKVGDRVSVVVDDWSLEGTPILWGDVGTVVNADQQWSLEIEFDGYDRHYYANNWEVELVEV